jgi:hypothetical protein
MRWSWKIVAPVGVVICGAAITWQVHKARANERLVEDAKVSRINAERGDAKAQYSLGHMYYHGQGVGQDYAEAARWYRKGADQGDAKCQYGLGYMYYRGQGVSQDYAEAVRWYREGTAQGDAMAQDGLGLLYYQGRGVPQDYAEAARWYRKAADQGYAKAEYDLGFMYYHGQGVQQDRAEGDYWYRKAADQGDEYAQRALGLRGKGLNARGAISFAAVFLWSLWVLKDPLSRGRGVGIRQQRTLVLCGLFGLTVVGLRVYRAFGVFHSLLAANAFYFTELLVVGIWITMAISVIAPKGARFVLAISGVLFIGVNLVAIARHDLWRFNSAIRGFISVNGLLLGISISAAFLQWLTHKRSRDEINLES